MKQLITMLLLSMSVTGFAQVGEKNFIDQNYIEVIGKAELEILPDMIYLKIVLKDKENKDKLELAEIEKRMIASLSDAGIDTGKDLSLVDFMSNLKSDWLKSNVLLTKQYQLIVHDSKTLQKVFSDFQSLGISTVSIEKVDHSQMDQYRREIKVTAIKAAKDKATALASGINQSVGRALYIQEIEFLTPHLASNVVEKSKGMNAKIQEVTSLISSMTTHESVEFGKIKVESAILARFDLK